MKSLKDAIDELKRNAEKLNKLTHKNMIKVAQLKKIMNEEDK